MSTSVSEVDEDESVLPVFAAAENRLVGAVAIIVIRVSGNERDRNEDDGKPAVIVVGWGVPTKAAVATADATDEEGALLRAAATAAAAEAVFGADLSEYLRLGRSDIALRKHRMGC
jgi:hypothetical protein